MLVQKFPIQPTYKKENGMWLLDLNDLVMPEGFVPVENSIVSIPPGVFGGNHKHPRREMFLATSASLQFIWLDEAGKRQEEMMVKNGELCLFFISPDVPHAVLNIAKKETVILYEWADAKQHDVERVEIL